MVRISELFLIVIAYLLGSIPSAVWIGKAFYNKDVRQFGSGNAGATNVFRVLGKKAGIPVLIIDILKGFFAVQLPYLSDYQCDSVEFVNLRIVLGIMALVGHIFPVFASFRGGKGIATLVGVVIAIHPNGAIVAIVTFLIVFLLFNYVSLASILSAIAFPISVIVVYKCIIPSVIIFSILIAIVVLITHKKNIKRLIARKESKIYLLKKRQD